MSEFTYEEMTFQKLMTIENNTPIGKRATLENCRIHDEVTMAMAEKLDEMENLILELQLEIDRRKND